MLLFFLGVIVGIVYCLVFSTINYIEQVNLANPRFRDKDLDRTGTPVILSVWCVSILLGFIMFPIMFIQAALHATSFMVRSRVAKRLGWLDPGGDVSP